MEIVIRAARDVGRKFSLFLASLIGCLAAHGGADAQARVDAEDHNLRAYAVNVFRNPKQSWPGYGIYLGRGQVLTAAHVLAGSMAGPPSVLIAGEELPARIVRQGDFETVDLTLVSIDERRLPARLGLRLLTLCQTPPKIGQDVVVAIPEAVVHSTIKSPALLAPDTRRRFPTVIADVATTGNSGSGVFDAQSQCLMGIMSRKIQTPDPAAKGPVRELRDVAKYFVPAADIAAFVARP